MSSYWCGATTSKGNPCINKVGIGRYCHAHNPHNWCGAQTTRGTKCRRTKAYGTERCSKHQ